MGLLFKRMYDHRAELDPGSWGGLAALAEAAEGYLL
jgi:hypothetical protein